MDNKNKVKKDLDGPPCMPSSQRGLKFAPKVPPKKAAKVVPKTEPADEIKDETIDKELLTKPKMSQSMDPFARRIKTEKRKPIHKLHLGKGTLHMQGLHPQQLSRNTSTEEALLWKSWYLRESAEHTTISPFPASCIPSFTKEARSVAEPSSNENVEPASTRSKMTHEEIRSLSPAGSKLKELPRGFVGKILVYKGGKVKMKMGDALFDEVAAVNTREKHCCTLGEVGKHVIIAPNVDHLLDSINKM